MRFILPIILFVTSLSYGLYRISHPLENRSPIDRITSNESDQNDDLVTYYTAKNFLEEGFSKNKLLPNRKGAISLSFWGIPCHGASGEGIKTFDLEGKEIEVYSKNNDCVYTRLPPLPDLLFALYSKSFGLSYTKLKVAAVIFKNISALILFVFLVRVFSFWPALFSSTIFLGSFYFQGWSASLYHQAFQYLFINLLLLNYVTKRSGIFCFLLSLLLSLTTYEFLLFIPLTFVGLSVLKSKLSIDKSQIIFYGIGSALGVIIHVVQNYFYFGNFEFVLNDFFNTVGVRYSESGIGLFEGLKVLKWYFDEYFLGIWLPLVLLIILMGKSILNQEKTFLGYLLILAGAFSIVFYIPVYAFKHFHHFFHHFYIFILVIYSDFFKSFFRQPNLRFVSVFVFALSVYLNSGMLKRDYNFIRDQRANYNEDNHTNKVDFVHLFQKKFSEDKWLMYGSKYSLIDNVHKERKYYRKRRQNVILSAESNNLEAIFFFRESVEVNFIHIQADAFSETECQFYNESERFMKDVEVDMREEKQGWHIFKVKPFKTDALKVVCSGTKGSIIYELQIF